MAESEKYFEKDPEAPVGQKSSVHYGNTFRLQKAQEQAQLAPASRDEIIRHVNDFLVSVGMKPVAQPTLEHPNPDTIDYKKIQAAYGLTDVRDLVWMKFTEDGYLGVVAASNDINFIIPPFDADYNAQDKGWVYNTSGILVHALGKTWDESFVLVFPLQNIPEAYDRGAIERGIGNYLLAHGVPILDYYSHNY